jgi:class 3 adenylate cyclase/predicted ATPase
MSDGRAIKPGLAGSAGAAVSRAERRHLTVVLCDLVNSTRQARGADPEAWREDLDQYQRCIRGAISEGGGRVTRIEGDSALAVFGFPHAHENDAERAIRSALRVADAVSRLRFHEGHRPQVRIGIATGMVVIGDIGGTPDEVAGTAPHLARRLQELAKPDTVVIDAETRNLAKGTFEHEDLGLVELKGFSDIKVNAWQVIGASARGRFEAQHPLVGRDAELRALLDSWREARAGRGQVILLSGEPGIGKSRLTEALRGRARAEPHIPIRYFCSQHTEGTPLHPFIEQLERAADFARTDSPESKLGKLSAALARGDQHEQDFPLIADLLSLPPDERYPKLQLTPQKRREQSMEALMRQLELLAQKHPLLMVFEDAHWIDPTSRALLEIAIDRLVALPVLGVITYRPDGAFQPAQWMGKPHVSAMHLRPLARTESVALIENIAGRGALAQHLLADIVERTDGVPLFLEELTAAVLEASRHAENGTSQAREPAHIVPTTLRASLVARIDRLDSAKDILQIGATIGREFSHDLLAAVCGEDESALRAALDRIVASGLVYRSGTGAQEAYLFKHALVQDAAYDTMLRARRQQLHESIAGVLENTFKDTMETQPELLAHHCTEANMNEKAVAYWLKAGVRALLRSMMLEAIARLRRGLEVVARLPLEIRDQHELNLQLALGKGLLATEGYAAPRTGATFARARELCEALNQPPQLVSVWHGQWTHALLRAELTAARRSATELLERGRARNDAIWTLVGHRCCGITHFPLGEFGVARDYLERGLELFDPAQRAVYSAVTIDDPQVVMLTYLSWALLYAGDLDQARQRRELALAEARRMAQPYSLTHALVGSAFSEMMVRAPDAALRYLDELLVLTEEHGIAYYQAVGTIFRGWCLARTGDARAALEVITQGIAAYRDTKSVLYLPTFLTLLADVQGRAGEPAQGITGLAEAARIADETQTLNDAAETHRVRGKLLIAMRQPAAAEASLSQALAVARRQGAKLLELRAAGSLAALWQGQDRRDEARKLLGNVCDSFTEGFDTPALREARRLVEALRS